MSHKSTKYKCPSLRLTTHHPISCFRQMPVELKMLTFNGLMRLKFSKPSAGLSLQQNYLNFRSGAVGVISALH